MRDDLAFRCDECGCRVFLQLGRSAKGGRYVSFDARCSAGHVTRLVDPRWRFRRPRR